MMASSLGNTMKAAAYTSNAGGIHKHINVTNSWPLPKGAKNLPKDATLVRVSHATLNPVDYKVPELPLVGRLVFSKGIPGLDYAGTVVESTLSHLKPGEPVFGSLAPPNFSTLGEYIIAGKEGCVPIPNGVQPKDASALGIAGLTAYQTVVPFVKSGNKVFINGGSGGVGTFQIQIAKILGCHVTVTCSGANVELCKSLGADEVIDYRTQDVVQTLTRKGQQYDLIADNVFNSADIYWSSHKYLKPEGSYVTIAGNAEFAVVKNMLSIFLWPSALGGGQRKFQFVTCAANAVQYAELAKWVAEGKMKVIIEREFSLEQAGEALERLKSGRTRGKLVVNVA
jgi:NADPH:quinone reductase-like Zn-dependent oxidoreductase